MIINLHELIRAIIGESILDRLAYIKTFLGVSSSIWIFWFDFGKCYILTSIHTTRVSCATLSSFILANSPNSSISSCLSCNSLTQFVENPWLAQSFNMVTIIVLSLRKSPLSNVLLSTAWREDVNAAQRLSWKKAANNAVFITSLYCLLSPCYHKYWQDQKEMI